MTNEGFIQIPININISNEDIDDILEKALNEGSLHWCYDAKCNHNIPVSKGGSLLIYGMDGSVYKLTLSKIMWGIQQAMPYLARVINGINLDVRSINSDDADFIIQLAIFNELVFE